MKKYYISSSVGGPALVADVRAYLETLRICLTYLVHKLHEGNHVKGISLEAFLNRLNEGLDGMGLDLDYESDSPEDDEEIHGTYTCEFDFSTSSSPKEIVDLLVMASSANYVYQETGNKSEPINIVQIMLSDDEDNWISCSCGGIDAQEGFLVSCWLEDLDEGDEYYTHL